MVCIESFPFPLLAPSSSPHRFGSVRLSRGDKGRGVRSAIAFRRAACALVVCGSPSHVPLPQKMQIARGRVFALPLVEVSKRKSGAGNTNALSRVFGCAVRDQEGKKGCACTPCECRLRFFAVRLRVPDVGASQPPQRIQCHRERRSTRGEGGSLLPKKRGSWMARRSKIDRARARGELALRHRDGSPKEERGENRSLHHGDAQRCATAQTSKRVGKHKPSVLKTQQKKLFSPGTSRHEIFTSPDGIQHRNVR